MTHLKRLTLVVVSFALALSTGPLAQQPTLAVDRPPTGKKVLVLTHAALTKHASVAVAEQALPEIARMGGFEVTIKSDGRETTGRTSPEDLAKMDFSFLTPGYLNQFDALLLFTNGNLPITQAQKQSITDFVRNGKAVIGVHCATVTLYDYPEFGEMMGAYYQRSIVSTDANPKRFVVLKVEDPNHPATRVLGTSWPFVEEYYMFGRGVWNAANPKENVSGVGELPIPMAFSRDRVKVLLSIDTQRTDLRDLPHLTADGDYPQSWYREYGKGRSFYTSLGHRPDTWSDPVFAAHLIGGIRWALGVEK
ncbi:MAG: ThuA domain-containing protein [Vicinamibacterales bacterium]